MKIRTHSFLTKKAFQSFTIFLLGGLTLIRLEANPLGWERGAQSIVAEALPEQDQAAKQIRAIKTAALETAPTFCVAGALPEDDIAGVVTPAIQDLARGLDYDVEAIFRYVHDNIGYQPYYGSLKGAHLTLMEESGNDFDQAALLIALLRESGYEAGYRMGELWYTYYELSQLLGVGFEEHEVPLGFLYGQSGIPAEGMPHPSIPGSDPGIMLRRVWVEVTVEGTVYRLDPAYKRTFPDYDYAIDIAAAIGYNQSNFLSALGGQSESNWVSGLSFDQVENLLTDYTSNLVETIDQSYASKDADGILGYQKVTPLPEDAEVLSNFYFLPYTKFDSIACNIIPDTWQTSFTVTVGNVVHEIFTSELRGRRLSLTVDSQGQGQLWLDDVMFGSPSAATSNDVSVTLAIDHPYNIEAEPNYADHEETKIYKKDGRYAIVYGFGGSGTGQLLKERQQILEAYQAMGKAEDSREVVTETLNVFGLNWLQQVALSGNIIDRISGVRTTIHHDIGRVGQEKSYYIDLGLRFSSLVATAANSDADDAAFRSRAFFDSAMEHGVLEQLQGADRPAVSTVKALYLNNESGKKTYFMNSSNFNPSNLDANYDSALLQLLQKSYINKGFGLLLPQNGQIPLEKWSGVGYVAASEYAMGMLISGGLYGGLSGGLSGDEWAVDSNQVIQDSVFDPDYYNPEPANQRNPASNEPIDLATGAYYYDRTDLTVGSGAAPWGLQFSRNYNSHRHNQATPLGYGWTHNYDSGISIRSDIYAALGKGDGTQASACIVAAYICQDLMTNPGENSKKWLAAALVAQWASDQILENAVSVKLGKKTIQYIKLPDGSYAASPGVSTQLTKEGANYILRESPATMEMHFGANEKLSAIKDSSGNTMSFTYDAEDRVQRVTDATGLRYLDFNYTGDLLSSVSDFSGRSIAMQYQDDALTGLSDPDGHTWGYSYDTEHRMDQLNNPDGRVLAINHYDSEGRVELQESPKENATYQWHYLYTGKQTIETDPDGGRMIYRFDHKGQTIATVDPLGNKTETTYDGQGRRIRQEDALGREATYTYNTNHNILTLTDPQGTTTSEYDSQFRLNKIIDKNENETTFSYDTKHLLRFTTSPLGKTNETTYDANGRVKTQIDPKSNVTSYFYDLYSNVRRIVAPDLSEVSFNYSTLGDQIKQTDPRGYQTTYQYNNRRFPTQATNQEGESVTTTYDSSGNVATFTDALENTKILSYTRMNKPKVSTASDAAVTQYFYDSKDQLIRSVDPLGNETFSNYDLARRLISAVDDQGNTTTFEYNAVGNLEKLTNAMLQETLTEYDNLNRPTVTTNALQDQSELIYDAVGNRTGILDYRGNLAESFYDAANQLVRLEMPEDTSGVGTRFAYEDRGLIETQTEPSGQTTNFTYDNMARVVQSTDPLGTISYTYDAAGNLLETTEGSATITRTYDTLGRIASYLDSQGNLIQYRYNANGNLSTLIYPDGKEVQYRYDTMNRLSEVEDWQGRVTQYNYDLAGRLDTMTRPNGTLRDADYNELHQISKIREETAAGVRIMDWEYVGYDALGRITSIAQRPVPEPQPDNFAEPFDNATHDGNNRIVSISGSAVSYDLDGNMINGPIAADNLNVSFTYDSRNRLTQADGATYAYDTENNRTSMTYNGEATEYVSNPHAGLSQLLVKIAADGSNTYYVYGLGLIYSVDEAKNTTNYHFDHLGSTIALTDDSATVTDRFEYSPYGTLMHHFGTSDTEFLYNGQYGVLSDPNGLINMRARYYNPYLRRFINADPIGFAGGMNWFAYAGGNPIMYVDPSGNITFLSGVIGGAIGAVAGAVGQFGVDVVNVAFNDGEFSSASTYAGAIAGGATTGAVLGTTFNPYLAGAAGGAVGNATTQAIDVATGKRDGFSVGELAFGTTVGAATAFIPGPKITPFNSGSNSFTAIAKSTQTKLANGTIQNVSLKTSAKTAFGQTFDKALFQGSLVGAAGGFVPRAFDQGSIFNSNLSSGLK